MMDYLKKNPMIVLCVLFFIAMLFPIGVVDRNGDEESVIGFEALFHAFTMWIVLIGPILLAAMDHIPQFDGRQKLLSVLVPIVCIVAVFISYLIVSGDYYYDVKFGFGSVLLLILNLVMLVVCSLKYREGGLNKIKDGIDAAKEVISAKKK